MSTVATPSNQVKSPMKDPNPKQELVRASAAGTILASPADYSAYIAQARSRGAHVLSPVTDIGSLPANWAFVPSAVFLSPDETAGDVYKDNLFCKGDSVAPTKIGLRKLASGAGISWKVVREDSGHVPYYWAMKCTISFRGHDGLMKEREASYEWDLRDGSPRLQKSDGVMSSKELNRSRLNGLRRCEAGAINAAIREYGIKQTYSKAELAKPFVVFNLVFQPETEEQKNMLAQAALTGTTMLYGGTAALPAPDLKVIDVVDANAKIPDEVPFDESDDRDDDAVLAAVLGVTQSGASDFYVTVEGVGKVHTNDRAVAKTCNDARRDGFKVAVIADGGELLEVSRTTTKVVAADKY